MTIHDAKPPQNAVKTADPHDKRPHAIVIGAGFGGLAAAVRLGVRGFRVTILDKLDDVGGRAYVTRQDGYTFDGGPTIITAPFVYEELWTISGKKMADHVTLKQLEPCYTIRFDNGDTFNTYSDAARMRAEVAKFNPKDVAGYEAFLRESERCFQTGFEKMIDKPFPKLRDMVKALPGLIARRAERSVHKLASKYVKDERLRIALSFHPLFIGGSPLKTSGVMSLISFMERKWGVHYVMGGTGALAQGMADLVRGHQGTIRTGVTVDEILIDNGKATGVRLADGTEIASDIVVSNAETGWTYTHLLRNQRRKRWTDAKVNRAKYSMSLFVWYFGTDKKFDDVEHHTILLGPRYQGLLKDIFDKKHLAKDFSLYLYRPTHCDPSMAPEGCDSFYVLAPVPNLEGTTDWEAHAETYRQAIQDRLEETIMPGLGEHVVTQKIMTPNDFRDRLLSTKGAAFGMQPLMTQLAWFRPHNKSEEFDNLYMVGAGTHPGAGVPAVVSSAKILDTVVPDAKQFA